MLKTTIPDKPAASYISSGEGIVIFGTKNPFSLPFRPVRRTFPCLIPTGSALHTVWKCRQPKPIIQQSKSRASLPGFTQHTRFIPLVPHTQCRSFVFLALGNGKGIAPLILRMPRMPFDPDKINLMLFEQPQQLFP